MALRGLEGPIDREAAEGERAGTVLHGLVRELLEESGLNPSELACVAAVRGPGSFTGLRVALAAAQGLCLATGSSGVVAGADAGTAPSP